MSSPRAILPATGGGALLAGVFYRPLFLSISTVLLALLVTMIVRTLRQGPGG